MRVLIWSFIYTSRYKGVDQGKVKRFSIRATLFLVSGHHAINDQLIFNASLINKSLDGDDNATTETIFMAFFGRSFYRVTHIVWEELYTKICLNKKLML